MHLRTILFTTSALSATFVFGYPLEFNITATPKSSVISHLGQNLRRSQLAVTGVQDLVYTIDVALDSKDEVYTVVLDSGSSEFWVSPLDGKAVRNSKSLPNVSPSVILIGGTTIRGAFKTANLNFAGETISDQAFYEASSTGGLTDKGVLGLRIDLKNNLVNELKDIRAYRPLQRVFMQDTKLPHYVTVLLGRSQGEATSSGKFTIGETLREYVEVEEQPKLKHPSGESFKFLMDEDSILDKDDKAIDLGTKPLTAIADTGFTLTQVPFWVAQAIYGGYPGAREGIYQMDMTWFVPCTQEVKVTIQLGGKKFPIHPLDATMDPGDIDDSDDGKSEKSDDTKSENSEESEGSNQSYKSYTSYKSYKSNKSDKSSNSDGSDKNKDKVKMCIGTFQPMSIDTDETDIVLGASFLRNAYLLNHYGSDIKESKKDGYTQLLPLTTDSETAHKEFEAARCNGEDCDEFRKKEAKKSQ